MGKAKILGSGMSASIPPIDFTYTGSCQIEYDNVQDGNTTKLAFTLKLLTSGTLNIKSMKTNFTDVYVIGGGGGGGAGGVSNGKGGGGGAGAYLEKSINIALQKNTDYPVVIGAGGAGGVVEKYYPTPGVY